MDRGSKVDESVAFPWRICLAGGWLDQPWVSEMHPGPVIVVNVRPHPAFKTRSGLATSTRTLGIELWGGLSGGAPPCDVPPERLARLLFNVENPVDCAYVSGSQDALGLMLPGVNRLDYAGHFWPEAIRTVESEASVAWLERVLWLVPLPSRPAGYDPLARKALTTAGVGRLAAAADSAWSAIEARDAESLGRALGGTMAAWRELLPETVPAGSDELCAPYGQHFGCLFSGAGGGFLLVVADEGEDVVGGFHVQITRRHDRDRPTAAAHHEGTAEQLATARSRDRAEASATLIAAAESPRSLSDNLGLLLALLCVALQLFILAHGQDERPRAAS